jgi:hypothetical protein
LSKNEESNLRRILLAGVLTAGLVVPASTSASVPIPPINCGIVSCTYPVDRLVDRATGGTEDIQECVRNTEGAIRNLLQGTPQPAVCNV